MRLPNAEQAFVDIEKLRNYCLNMNHPRGRNKARIFASLLGLTVADAKALRKAILKAVVTEDAETGEGDVFGQRYTVDFQMDSPNEECDCPHGLDCAEWRGLSSPDELLYPLR